MGEVKRTRKKHKAELKAKVALAAIGGDQRVAEPALRWTAAGMMEAQKSLRRLKAYRQLPILRSALQNHMRKAQADSAIETTMKAA